MQGISSKIFTIAGLILGLRWVNERRHYFVEKSTVCVVLMGLLNNISYSGYELETRTVLDHWLGTIAKNKGKLQE